VNRSRSHSLASQSLSGSHRSRESGVGSLGGDSSFMEPLAEEKPRLMVDLPVRDKSIKDPLMEVSDIRGDHTLEPLEEESQRLTAQPSSSSQKEGLELALNRCEGKVAEEEEHSPSPFLPKRKAVISLAVMEEKKVDPEEIVGEDVVDEDLEGREQHDSDEVAEGGKEEEEEDIGSPFQWMDTVYV